MTKQDAALQVWPRPQHIKIAGKGLTLKRPLRLATHGDADWLAGEARNIARLMNRAAGKTVVTTRGGPNGPVLTVTTMDALPSGCGLQAVNKPEGYALSVTGKGVVLAGKDAAGAYYGAQTLAQLMDGDRSRSLPGVTVRDWPRFPMRGAHLYMPPRRHLDFFLRFLDFLARHKCNVLILEFGGGMEYERHPEINRAWRKFCRDAKAYDRRKDPDPSTRMTLDPFRDVDLKEYFPSGINALESSRYFPKNSTHTELAGGEWLSKDEVRKIVAECAKRHIEIIPEVQSLSHSYYLCLGHPEIAERGDDPWPDSYCPSNPKSYELLFDVMEEVIELVQPRTVSIGHDEIWTLRVCPECRKRSGHELIADDVKKVHGFLAERGIRTLMWGDKLMNITMPNGRRHGGVPRRRKDPGVGKSWILPPTWEAARHVPKDLIVADWYWSLDPKSERKFHKHGFEVLYGNFNPLRFRDWERRGDLPFVLGAEMSSWCEVSSEAFGHDGIFYKFFPGSDMLWRGTQMKRDRVCALMARRMAPVVDELTQKPRWLVSNGKGKVACLDLSRVARPLPEDLRGKLKTGERAATVLGTGAFALLTNAAGYLDRALVLDKSNAKAPRIPIGGKAKKLLLLHGTTMDDVYFRPTYNSYHRGPGILLQITVRYVDGKRETFVALYGEDIGSLIGSWPTRRGGYCYRSVPVEAGSGHTLFAQEWTNPRPKVAIAGVDLRLGPDSTDNGAVVVAALSLVK